MQAKRLASVKVVNTFLTLARLSLQSVTLMAIGPPMATALTSAFAQMIAITLKVATVQAEQQTADIRQFVTFAVANMVTLHHLTSLTNK